SGLASRHQFLVWLGVALVIVYVLKSAFLGLLAYARNRFIFSLQTSIGTRLLAVHMRRPYDQHLRTNSAVLVRKINGDLNRVVGNVLVPLASLAIDSLIACAIVALLLVLRLLPTLLIVLGLGGVAAVYYF